MRKSLRRPSYEQSSRPYDRQTGQNSHRCGDSAESERPTDRKGHSGAHLVNEVAHVREDSVTQFHARQTRTESGAQVLFKTLEDMSG